MYNLRGGFLVRPLSIALTLGCAGAVLSWSEEATPAFSQWVPSVLFPTHADPQIAQIILGGIATSMMTVVSIVFAILLMTLTLPSMQFSPRIIISFTRDRVTQWTLGIFLGTFLYCMAALPAARSLPRPFAPIATVLGAILLAIACVGWLLFFIHHISQAISVNQIVDRIASETESVIDEMMPWPLRPDSPTNTDTDLDGLSGEVVLNGTAGYIRFLDTKRLIALAKSYHVRIHVLRRVNPRAAFAGHTLNTPWDLLHRAYFNGYARWTYLTTPFLMAMPGFEVAEIAPWQEGAEHWRGLRARFPDAIASHSREQGFYFGDDFLLRRHDYCLAGCWRNPGSAIRTRHCRGRWIPLSGEATCIRPRATFESNS
jgi:uncharacterized membrane protein